jgi:hypothetical protein
MYSMVGAISTEPVWCSCSWDPGSAMKSGSSARARLIFTTPLRDFQCSMSETKSSGRYSAPTCSRKAVRGCSVDTTTWARISSPFSSTTPTARSPATAPGPPRADPDLRSVGARSGLDGGRTPPMRRREASYR